MKSGKCHKNGKVQVLLSIKSIARVTGVARNTVRRYLRKPAG